MKHNVEKPDLAGIYNSKNLVDRREEKYLAFEAEFDINRPFELQWVGEDDLYFIYDDGIYFYKPQYGGKIIDSNAGKYLVEDHKTAEYIGESPHFIEFRL